MAGTIEDAAKARQGAGGTTLRLLVVAALYCAGALALWWAGAGIQSDLQRPGPLPPDVAVEAAGALAAWACLLWWGLAFVATALGALPGACGRAAARYSATFAPATVRRLTGYVLGAALASGTSAAIAAPAGAVTAPPAPLGEFDQARPGLPSLDRPGADGPEDAAAVPGSAPSPDATARRATDGTGDPPSLCLPGGPQQAHRHGARPDRISPVGSDLPTGARTTPTATVVVRAGDTLWGIAARHLGPRAQAADVAASWPRWYRANADAVGIDPDLIRPGLRLRPVPTAEETR